MNARWAAPCTPLLAGGALMAALAALAAWGSAAPAPPSSGDWVIDPAEVVTISGGNLTVDGNITLGASSELHLTAVRLVFADGAQKRAVTGPASSVVTLEASSVSAAVGPGSGGFGYYIRVDGTLRASNSSFTGLSGQTIPNPFGETEGLHLVNSASSVTGCSISGAQGYAVTVTLGALPATVAPLIADNRIQNSGGGVFLSGLLVYGADAQVLRNSFSFNTFPHVVVSGSSPTIEGNTFFGSTAGVTVFAGNPRIANNSFLATLLAAVTVSSGGGVIEDNTVSAAGVAFQVTGGTLSIRRNTVALTATGLQASGSTVTFDDNRVTGAFGTAALVNDSDLTGRGGTLESALGSPALRATNRSTVALRGVALSSAGGPGLVQEGGSLTLENVSVGALLSPLTAIDATVTLRDTTLSAGGSAAGASVRGGSFDATGGRVAGGTDGIFLDNATASIVDVTVTANAEWGIRSVHRTPTLGAGMVNGSLYGNGRGDLLVEADLTVVLVNAASEPVAGASVTITPAAGGATQTGLSGSDGRVGPVRLVAEQVDSLNNRVSYSPYSVRAVVASSSRATGLAPLASDFTLTLVVQPNSAPVVSLSVPTTAKVSTAFWANATATDAENDTLTYSWSTSDGRLFTGPSVRMAFDDFGNQTVTVTVSDGFVSGVASATVKVLSAAEANRPPFFTAFPADRAIWAMPYRWRIAADDPDGDLVSISLNDGPLGMRVEGHPFSKTADLIWDFESTIKVGATAANYTFLVRLRVTDGLTAAGFEYNVTLQVPANLPPAWKPLPRVNLTVGQSKGLYLGDLVEDPDQGTNELHFTLQVSGTDPGLGAFFAINNYGSVQELILVGLRAQDAGAPPIEVVLSVYDDQGGRANATLYVTVTGPGSSAAPQSPPDAFLVPSLMAIVAVGIAAWAVAIASRGRRPPASPDKLEPPKAP